MKEGIQRLLIIGLCVIFQLAFTLLILFKFSEQFALIHLILMIMSALIILGIIKNSKNLSSKIPWIILISLFPILGTLLYLIIGHSLYRSKILRKISKSIEKSYGYLKQNKDVLNELKDSDIYGQVKYITDYAKYPIYNNSEIKYFPLGELAFESMLEELKKAQRFIFIEYFIIEDGFMWQSILEILEEKVKNGVDVRVIYDDAGSIGTLKWNYSDVLERKGIKCICFNKLQPFVEVIMNSRDHRKIMIIDGIVAFSGGMNLADEYINKKQKYGHWKDNGIMIKGEAVWSFTNIFLEIWNAYCEEKANYKEFYPNIKENFIDCGYIAPYGENPLDNEAVGENIYLNILNQAHDYVYIFTPYLIIDTEMITALTLASKRGVDVRIITPGIPDKKTVFSLTKSYYEMLINEGIKIYEYMPGFVHSKVFVCDDKDATVGTLNLDYRSLYLHFECGVFIYKSNVIQDIKNDALDTFEKSHLIDKNECKVGFFKGLFNAVLRVFAPLL